MPGTARALLAGLAVAATFTAPARGATPTAREFPTGPGTGPYSIAAGPDGNMWFTEAEAARIGRISPSGAITVFEDGITAGSGPVGITAGPDGNMWFTEQNGDRIGRITPEGVVTEFSAGITAGSEPLSIAAGHDGNLWFTEPGGDRIGRITPAGVVTEFSSGLTANSSPEGIAAGRDGNIWFAESGPDKIGRITPAGVITEFDVSGTLDQPSGITAGPDGNLWFTSFADDIGRITPSGDVTVFSAGLTPSSNPSSITAGPDGNLWFTEQTGDRIGRITPAGVVTEFTAGVDPTGEPTGIAAGPDGNLWYANYQGHRVGRINTALPPMRDTDPARIVIRDNDAADPYPATIEVEGLVGTVTNVRVRLNGVHHSFAGDVEALLVGPEGQNALVMGESIAQDVVTGTVITFDDLGPGSPFRLVSGIFSPIHLLGLGNAAFAPPAPGEPYAGSLSVFDGTEPNGTWRLFIQDDDTPDGGVIAGGWSLDVQTTGPDPVQVPGPTVTNTVTVPGPTTTTTVPGPTVTVPAPRDTTDPTLTLTGVAARMPLATFRRAVTVRVTPSEPVTLDATLSVIPRRATIAQSLLLAERTTDAAATGAQLRLRPSARLLGRPKRRFRARLRLVATDTSGNRATATRTITVTPARRRR